MTASSQLEAACRFACESAHRPMPAYVRDAALRALVDWFAVSLAALCDPGPLIVRQQVQHWGTHGQALTLFGDVGAAGPVAMVNGTLSHSLDFDDMHFGTAVHATGPIMAAALGVGMDRGCPESSVLAAFVAGYEVATALGGDGAGTRLAAAGWHPTGVLCHFGAAVAAASLLELTPPQTAHALGLAATQAGGMQLSGGSMAKPFHVGKAAMNGVLAAELAALGMEASTDVLDHPQRGVLGVLFQQPTLPRLDDLGRVWQIGDNTFKPYAACQLTHAPHEAAQSLASGFRSDGLNEVRVRVNPLALKVAGVRQPTTTMEGKFSIGYCVALGLTGRVAGVDAFQPACIADPALQRLASLVTVDTCDSIPRCAAQISLTYSDGLVRRADLPAVRGSPERPLNWNDLEGKFLSCVQPVLGGAATSLLHVLRSFDQPGRLAQLREILATRQR